MICRSHTEARSFESCWNFLLYLALHFLLIALQNTSLTASKIAVPRLSNIVLVVTEFWPRRSANKRIPNKLGTRNGRVVKESELAVTKLSFWWRKLAMLHQVPFVLTNLPCTILILVQSSHNFKTCIEAWLFALIVFPVPFSQFHKLKDSIQLDKCLECSRSIDLFHSHQAWFDNFCYICQSWDVITSFINPFINDVIFWCRWHFLWITETV